MHNYGLFFKKHAVLFCIVNVLMYLCKEEYNNKIEQMIYFISKKLEISAAHSLTLSYESKCSNLHGHNWEIELFFVGKELNQDGMVIDFTHVKKTVNSKMDHANLNEVFDFNPTAENIGRWLVNLFPECY